ncbi:hypothetical protein UCDDA912_g09270 [Diaporthe ampelina]|uniref:Zn(2)-C6 fungal-type domain-containing protein n=1 Tax=Diaporthe ampelina TaxID=1214573 RepID=A0A0G2F7V7_9PEZI|nr:hypothetical protein UCDDA912_g09270 [Diaporthe ampelina]
MTHRVAPLELGAMSISPPGTARWTLLPTPSTCLDFFAPIHDPDLAETAQLTQSQCDEKRPCSACIRHDVKCSLLDNPPPAILYREQREQREQRERECSVTTSSASPEGSKSGFSATMDHRRSLPDLPDFNSVNSPFQSLSPPDPSAIQTPTATATFCPDPERHKTTTPPSADEDPFPYFDKFMLPIGGEREAAWIQDLELMHHYSVATSLTLPRAQDELHVWQVQVPKLAYKYPFLVHQILAVAAFHQAYLHPGQRSDHSLHASQHQNRSIEGMRGHLAAITSENCHALFMASSLLLVGAFASFANIRPNDSPLIEGQRPPTIEDMIDVFILDRGVASVLQSSEECIQAGYFRDLFHFQTHDKQNAFMPRLAEELRSLSAAIKAEPDVDNLVVILVDLEIRKLIDAIEKAVVTTDDAEMRVTTYWPITIAEDYIQLVRQRNEVALLVLMYYCCIMYRAEGKTWFVKGWGISVATDVERLISRRWREAIKWPLEQMGQYRSVV